MPPLAPVTKATCPVREKCSSRYVRISDATTVTALLSVALEQPLPEIGRPAGAQSFSGLPPPATIVSTLSLMLSGSKTFFQSSRSSLRWAS